MGRVRNSLWRPFSQAWRSVQRSVVCGSGASSLQLIVAAAGPRSMSTMKCQLLMLRDCSANLVQSVERGGPIQCVNQPIAVHLTKPPKIVAATGRVLLPQESVREMDRFLTLRCDFDTRLPGGEHARHTLNVVAIAVQLARPTRAFLKLWLQLDHLGMPELVSSPVRQLGFLIDSGVYLKYQQHNVLEEADVRRAVGIAPMVATALDSRYGSWDHPVLPIHRALVFFCQGYSVTPSDPRQFLWAAGLDCLFASKVDRQKQGSTEITKRLEKLLGENLIPYDTVFLPTHQKPRKRSTVGEIGRDVFRLRNAFAHGLSIPDPSWLAAPGQPDEIGYGYQLVEQTEILLRLSLLKILGDQTLFSTFSDPKLLDAYF